jgi:uncharacterized membrane protein
MKRSRTAGQAMDGVYFEALITPHRSLSRQGLRRVIVLLLALSALAALRFWFIGAWPVIAFTCIEVSLAILLLQLNAARAGASELVLLSADGARIIRTDWRGGRQESHVTSVWLNVTLEEPAGSVPRLLLTARDRQVEIGGFLGEAEKRDLAAAMRAAMRQAREPRFDNPQLRA